MAVQSSTGGGNVSKIRKLWSGEQEEAKKKRMTLQNILSFLSLHANTVFGRHGKAPSVVPGSGFRRVLLTGTARHLHILAL